MILVPIKRMINPAIYFGAIKFDITFSLNKTTTISAPLPAIS